MTDPTSIATAASIAASSQDMQLQQMQLLNQMTQVINSANASCAKGTDCYQNQQITDAQNAYNAAVITEKNAPQTVDAALKTFLVASKGQNGANQDLMSRYETNGNTEKAKQTQQFDNWFNDMTKKIDTVSQHAQTSATLFTSNKIANDNLNKIARRDDDAINELNLLERKTYYTAQNVKMINGIEMYFKMVYLLAFLTWIACIIYERTFTLKTGVLFVLFTVLILMQNWIINAVSSALSSFS